MLSSNTPKLITFDGEARSGKGTIVQATKDYLRDECGYNVMLIDAGQVFRTLVVAVMRGGVSVDNPLAIDAFLSNQESIDACTRLVKDIYHMSKDERDALLYTNEVGANSAKIGARPLSQEFKDGLLRKWLKDAADEGFEIVLLDGRALEETGLMLAKAGLCDFTAGLYFVCDPVVGARRTLGYAATSYEDLTPDQRADVDVFVTQIRARNEADRTRTVQPIIPPANTPTFMLPSVGTPAVHDGRSMAIIDTSAQMTKAEMANPVTLLVRDAIAK